MLVSDEGVVAKLRGLVEGFTFDPVERKDLLQEALLHLWSIERRRPEQTLSWYLQSCRFQVQHYLARGRSVDSRKRRFFRVEVFAVEDDALEDAPVLAGDNIDHGHDATVEDEIRVLANHLNDDDDRRMLQFLLDGLSLRDVASQLGISFPTARKRRRRIGDIFRRLCGPPLVPPKAGTFPPVGRLNFHSAATPVLA